MSQATCKWRGEPICPAGYDDVGDLVTVARQARGRLIDFDWAFTTDDLLRFRRAAHKWGSGVSGRYRSFGVRLLVAINDALGETDTALVLSEPKNAAETSSGVDCTREGDAFRLRGHAPFDVVFGYASAVQRNESLSEILAVALGELGWDLRRLQEARMQPVTNVLYGLPADYGIDPSVLEAGPAVDVAVHFHGPFSALEGAAHPCLFSTEISKRSGVYIWTIEVNGDHKPWYVGQTQRDFGRRTGEHLRSFLCGEYAVCDPQALARGENKVVWSPRSGVAGWPERLPAFLGEHSTLMPKVVGLIRLLRFHVAPLDGDRRVFDGVEGALGRHFGRVLGEFWDAGIKVPGKIPGQTPMRLLLTSDVAIAGLPPELTE